MKNSLLLLFLFLACVTGGKAKYKINRKGQSGEELEKSCMLMIWFDAI